MSSFFGWREGSGAGGPQQERVVRHSSGWAQMLTYLKAVEGLRVLDIGPTSSSNINFLTGLGHSIYMANIVEEAASPEWKLPLGEDGQPAYKTHEFIAQNLDFSGRVFDVVMLWDTLDYLPDALVDPVLSRLSEVMTPSAQMLAFFHSKQEGPEATFSRYHLTDSESLSLQRLGGYELRHAYTTRQVEQLLNGFSNHRFFLAKDALREVLVRR